jgi:hypothetical protein
LAIGVFATILTTLSLSLVEWRGVTTNNGFVAYFFLAAAFGLLIIAQWELVVGNGFAYTVFSVLDKANTIELRHSTHYSKCLLRQLRSDTDASIRSC